MYKVSKKPSCPSGYIIRESYISKSGKRVAARCIRKTGLLSGKSTEKTKKILSNALQRSKKALAKSKIAGLNIPSRCPKGMTLRTPYFRKSKTNTLRNRNILVGPKCIITRGKSTSKNRVIVLDPEDHYLSKYGYHNVEHLTKEQRHDALNKLIEHFIKEKGQMATYNYVIKALNARYILNRNTNPKIAKIMKQDQIYISKKYYSLQKKQTQIL
jgi:hypothetical protein